MTRYSIVNKADTHACMEINPVGDWVLFTENDAINAKLIQQRDDARKELREMTDSFAGNVHTKNRKMREELTTQANIIVEMREALEECIPLVQIGMEAHNKQFEGADPQSQFYGEDIVSPVVLAKARAALASVKGGV